MHGRNGWMDFRHGPRAAGTPTRTYPTASTVCGEIAVSGSTAGCSFAASPNRAIRGTATIARAIIAPRTANGSAYAVGSDALPFIASVQRPMAHGLALAIVPATVMSRPTI